MGPKGQSLAGREGEWREGIANRFLCSSQVTLLRAWEATISGGVLWVSQGLSCPTLHAASSQ